MAASKPIEADFHTAVICALDLEAREVERTFDEHYDHLDESVTQGIHTYAVTPGRIGHQNIVLLWMLKPGKADAMRASQALQNTYTDIRLYFVVGICGGVPKITDPTGNEAEVVLGDVCISTEILKHDERKTYDEHFDIVNAPVKPNSELMSFLKPRLAGRSHDAFQHRFHEIMQNSYRMFPGIPQYPGVEKDHLYESAYHHKHHEECFKCKRIGSCSEALDIDCSKLGCDAAKLVKRSRLVAGRSHAHAIHFGIIASGDTVMKSGKERDFIASMPKYKRRVVGFEMESAGICDDGLNVIVIKSVCDYSDSHKRKDWQRYTAFVGAAAFKAFVEAWGSRKRPGFTKIVHKISNIPQDVMQSVKIVTQGLDNQHSGSSSPCKGSEDQSAEFKNNIGPHGNLVVPGRSQHVRRNSSTSLRSFFRIGIQDSPITTSPGNNLHTATILSPKDDLPAQQYPITDRQSSQLNSNTSSPFLPQSLSSPQVQPFSQPHSQSRQQPPYRPSLHPNPPHRLEHSQITPPLDDSTQFPASTQPVYNLQTASQYFLPPAHVSGRPLTPPRTPPQTPRQQHVARFSTETSESRCSSMATVYRNNILPNTQSQISVASRDTIASSASGSVPSLNLSEGQGKRPVIEFPVFITACEDRDLVTMRKELKSNPIDLTSSASDGSNMLHLVLGTSLVDEDAMLPILDAVSLLCKYGANVNAKDRSGARPLHYCATTMNQKAAEVLLTNGAKVNYTDSQGKTPLNYLEEEPHADVELVKFFITKRGKLGKTASMSPMPSKPTRQQKLVRELLSVNNC